MKIRMKADNCNCWKKGEEFEAFDCKGEIAIKCHDKAMGGLHFLLDKKDNYIPSNVVECQTDWPDFKIVRN